LGKKIEGATCDEIVTRETERDLDAETSIYPDLLIAGQLPDKAPFAFYCEHKWDSHCDEQQLRKYLKVAENKGKHARLVFVGANFKQKSDAAKCLESNACTCFLWEDVFRALEGIGDKSTILQEFLGFMKTQGLSPGQPLTVERMKAFLQASGFLESLEKYANKLLNEYSWDALPTRFREEPFVSHRSGKVAIRFPAGDEWKPWIAVGFYYDERDHKVAFVNRSKGIDLILRVAAEPKYTKNIGPALQVLKSKRKELRKTSPSVLLKGEHGNGNNYSILIVHDCLADVIEGAKTEVEQLGAIHKRLTRWLEILFKDGELETAFKTSGLDSGMK
jgi:hypothetical protein